MLQDAMKTRDADRSAKLRFLATTLWWLDIAQQRVAEQLGGFGEHAHIVSAEHGRFLRNCHWRIKRRRDAKSLEPAALAA